MPPCAGFAVLLASEFKTVQMLGASVIGTLVLALLADLVVLPALLVLAGIPRTETDRLARLPAPPKRERVGDPGRARSDRHALPEAG